MSLNWSGADSRGASVSRGSYLLSATVGGKTATRPITLAR